MSAPAGSAPWRAGPRRRRLWIPVVVVVALAVIAGLAYLYLIRPTPAPAPAPISVVLGTPTTGSVTCAGATLQTETLPWVSSSGPVTNTQLSMEIFAAGEGNEIGGNNGPATVTTGSLCTGGAPTGTYDWYAVLVAPGGSNLASYTYSTGWQSVSSSPPPYAVTVGSALTIVSTHSNAGVGDGFRLDCVPGGPVVNGYSAL